ncbi:MAG: hypothetical protein APG11_01846 [Candidatus Methanofastidiosum methylothiophilum]|uniref:Uncharacterized protein n=1 Tax=Candidatus Methanofastidiosum methylothiophilum TaxID=1705564 RepID=A0A150INW0_9EURY|nr:MAG: hypothetical protein APG11_01846 [Candidatus Methanofastidiosum methylthiophilus]
MSGMKDNLFNIFGFKNHAINYVLFLVKNLLILFFWRRPILLLFLMICSMIYLFIKDLSGFNFMNAIWSLDNASLQTKFVSTSYYPMVEIIGIILTFFLFLAFFYLGYRDYLMQRSNKKMIISVTDKMKSTDLEDKIIGAQELAHWMKKDYLYDELLIYYLKK